MTGGGLRIGEEDVMSDGGAEVGIHGGVTIMSLCTNVLTLSKGETVSCMALVVYEFIHINDVQITGNKSFYVKGLLKIRKRKYIQAKVEFRYCLDVHRKDFIPLVFP